MNGQSQLVSVPGFAKHGAWSEIWNLDRWPQDMLPNGDLTATYRGVKAVNFGRVRQVWLKETAKRFVKMRVLAGTSIGSLSNYMNDIAAFSEWLEKNHPEVSAPIGLSREVVENYMLSVRRDATKGATKTRRIGTLKMLLEEQREDGLDGIDKRASVNVREIPRVEYTLPKRQITEQMFDAIVDEANLALVSAQRRTLIQIFAFTGLRISSVITLRRSAVTTGPDGHPYLTYLNIKMGREAIIPIPVRLSKAIRSYEALTATDADERGYLFASPKPDSKLGHITNSSAYRILKDYIRRAGVVDELGHPADFIHPHLFRHHVGTTLINDGVPITVVAKMLDHNSLQMTSRYAHLHDKTLRDEVKKWHERVNARGEKIALAIDTPLEDAEWMKERIARAKQALPNGYCGLPLVQTCPHPNACLSCDNFLTDASFIDVHREQLIQTRDLLSNAEAAGSARLVETLKSDEVALQLIIDGLEESSLSEVIDLRDQLRTEPE